MPIGSLDIGYDIRRFTASGSENELPGYWLFVSTDAGATWSNVSALNPAITGAAVLVPNTAGVTSVTNAIFTLPGAWTPGAALLLRWVDDNSAQTSPIWKIPAFRRWTSNQRRFGPPGESACAATFPASFSPRC